MSPQASNAAATAPEDSQPNGDGAAKEPPNKQRSAAAATPVGGANKADQPVRKSSAPFPSPVPTSWANPADLTKVRANTPLATTPVPNGVPAPPPLPAVVVQPQTPVLGHQVDPIPRPNRTKSDASSKSGAGKFRRMFGGGGGGGAAMSALPQTFADDVSHGVKHMTLAPDPTANGPRTPSSERNDPTGGPGSARSPSRASSVKDSAPPVKPPVRSNSHSNHDGRFTLKELLGAGGGGSDRKGLSRKSSASSRRSESSRGDEPNGGMLVHGGYVSGPDSVPRKARAPSSVGGDSATSLSQKYGVCDRGAIGKGATSVVRLAHKWDRSEEKVYAVKEFRKRRKNESEREYVKKLTAEFCISSTLHHPNVVETVDLVQDEHQNWCEVMEYCPGGDLYAAIKRGQMSPSEVECSFKQILLGVEYLHSQGVAHRDLKPENLFFDSKGTLKIGDYGASTVYRLPWETSVHMSTGLCGSEPYIAPEQFTNKHYDARLVDIWACGIVYYCLHFQELPWRVAQLSEPLYASYVSSTQSKNPSEAECPATINNLSPRACRPLLRRMLEPKPDKRILIEDVMKDAWIVDIEVCVTAEKPKHVHVNINHSRRDGGGN